MPTEVVVVNKITEEEQTAINTAAAMAASVSLSVQTHVLPRLDALEVAFRGYRGSFALFLPDQVVVHWNGTKLLGAVVTPDEYEEGEESLPPNMAELSGADPYIQFVVSRNVAYIASEFADFLNEVLTGDNDASV